MRPASFARFAPRSPSRLRSTAHAPRFKPKATQHTIAVSPELNREQLSPELKEKHIA